jgi:glutamate synthase (NADPH/NADH) large chain
MVNVENLNIRDNNENSNYDDFFQISDNILKDDDMRIKYLLDNHVKYTNSTLAKNIISNWKQSIKNFKKIMPVDYKRVLLDKKNNNLQSKQVA